MKTFLLFTFGVIAGLCAVRPFDPGQYGRPGDGARGDQVCVYKDINYQGAEQCYNGGEEINSLGDQSKSISSIRVYGRASVTVYENTSFRGHSAQFTSNIPDLGRQMMAGNTSWSDHIDSLRIFGVSRPSADSDRRNPRDFRRDREQQPRDGICVYDRPNYEGRTECWNQGRNISDLARQTAWGGQISSIRLFGRSMATVFQDTDYGGESLIVDRNIADLAAIPGLAPGNGNGKGNGRGRARGRANGRSFENWDHQISSLQVQAQRRNQ